MEGQKRTIRDRLYMPPMKKYRIYGIYPWKITIHLLIVILTSCQVILIINHTAMYSLGQNILWNLLFLDKDASGGSEDTMVNSYNLFTAADLTSYVQGVVNGYYDVNSGTLDNYNFQWVSGVKKSPKLWAEYLDDSYVREGQFAYEYNLTRIDLGPLSTESIKAFLNAVRIFQIEFQLEQQLPSKLATSYSCYTWTIKQVYQFEKRGPINVSLDLKRTMCSTSPETPFRLLDRYQWLSLTVGVLAFLSFCITWSSIMRRAVLLARLHGQRQSAKAAWESLDLSDMLKFFNFWVLITILGNLLQIFGLFYIGGIISVFDQGNALEMQESIVGFGCFFAWVNSVGYLEHNSPAYTIINTLKRAVPIIAKYIIGVMPIFMAYAFLGIALFWSTSYYPNPIWAMMILFANVNGDSLYLLLSATTTQYFFLGQVYYFTFLVFFICCVQNLFVSLINEGFMSLIIRPMKAGDESEDEDESDFRPVLYSFNSASPKARITDKEIKSQSERMSYLELKAEFAFNRLMSLGRASFRLGETAENTQAIIAEMNGIINQLDDFLWDLRKLLTTHIDEAVDRPALRERILKALEVEIPTEIKAALE